MTAAQVEVIEAPERAAVLLQPVRLEILDRLREPDSAAGLARRMGQPRQRLNHHLHELERAGFLEFVEERRKGNCLERLYRSRASHYLISPGALGPLAPAEPEAFGDRFSWAHLLSLVGKALRDLTALRRRADRAEQRLATFSLATRVRFASPRAMAEFSERLAEAVGRLVAEVHDEEAPRGRWYELFLGSYSAITEGGAPAPPAADERSDR